MSEYSVSSVDMVLTVNGQIIAPESKWRARASDPPTSKEAARKCESFRVRHESLIYDAIRGFGERGATSKELSKVMKLTDVQIARRLGGMSTPERRLIETTGDVRDGCRAWRIAK